MRRAIEWGAGAGSTPAPVYNVLMIVGNLTLSSKDVGYKALIESWGHTVTLIDDGDSQANYDTAMAAADVILASGSAIGSSILDKPTNTTKGLVNEVNGKIDNFGFSSSTSSTVNTDTFTKTDPAHYITEPFSGNPVTVFTASLTNPVPGGTLAPDLQNVGEDSGTLALGTLDTGAIRYDSNPSTGRRAHLPFASAEATDLTADGETILRRTIEWAAGAGGGGGGGVPDVTVTLTSVQDTQVRAGTTFAYGSSPSMSLNAGSPVIRPLLQFDVSSIAPGTVITSATLRLNQATLITPGSMIAKARKVTEVWDEKWGGSGGANWTNRFKQGGSTLLWATPGVTFDPAWESQTTFDVVASEWVEWDITPLVQEWVDGENNGVVIEPITVGPYVNFHTRDGSDPALDPQLVITHP
jgi:hypothetical protein